MTYTMINRCYRLSIEIDLSFVGLVSKSNDLPSITASLFLSPGGRKFLDFMNAFVRYVAKHCLIKVSQIKWKFSILPEFFYKYSIPCNCFYWLCFVPRQEHKYSSGVGEKKMVGGGNNVQKNMNYSRDRKLLSNSLPILDFNLRNIAQVLAASHKVSYLKRKE